MDLLAIVVGRASQKKVVVGLVCTCHTVQQVSKKNKMNKRLSSRNEQVVFWSLLSFFSCANKRQQPIKSMHIFARSKIGQERNDAN